MVTYLGKPCKRGHDGTRYKSRNDCVQCAKDRARVYWKDKPEAFKAYTRKANEKHREYHIRWARERRKTNKENIAAYRIKYREENKDYFAAWASERRAKRRKAQPKWLTKEQKHQIYFKFKIAVNISDISGIEHHVDHIIPLNGKNCSGLHVPWNLRVLEGALNVSKGNKLL